MRKALTLTFITILAITTMLVIDSASGTQEQSITSDPPHTAKSVPFQTGSYLVFDGAAVQAEIERHEAEVAAYLQAVEAERIAAEEAARREAAARNASAASPQSPAPEPRAVASGTYEGCDGIDWVIPVHIVWRESRCNFHAINYNGCGGWTCVGAYQFDLRHWIPRDQGGWGGCAHFGDWAVPENQIECARQMSRGGTYLAPWGG